MEYATECCIMLGLTLVALFAIIPPAEPAIALCRAVRASMMAVDRHAAHRIPPHSRKGRQRVPVAESERYPLACQLSEPEGEP